LKWGGRSGGGRKNQTKTMSPFVRRGDIIIIPYIVHDYVTDE
jgi:hypothetical protein